MWPTLTAREGMETLSCGPKKGSEVCGHLVLSTTAHLRSTSSLADVMKDIVGLSY